MPLTGLTVTTVEIALVSYTLLILYRNMVDGLRAVPADALEAARGMGLTRRQTFVRVELPLATPAIIAGLRIATVSTISIATIVAFVIPKGLGRPIFTALGQDVFKTEILAAGGARGRARALRRRPARARAARRHAVEPRRDDRRRPVPARARSSTRSASSAITARCSSRRRASISSCRSRRSASALVLALPLGLWLGHRHRGFFFAASVSNVGRALPSLVLIAFGLTIFGVGFWNNTAALVVLAIPPILTNAYFAIDGVDRDVVEAARGMGLSERQVLWQVELPLGLPLVIAGIRIATIFVIATATIAAVAGGGGLGEIIVNQASYGLAGVVGASFCVSALTLLAALGLGSAPPSAVA